jgi:hypothetical protein
MALVLGGLCTAGASADILVVLNPTDSVVAVGDTVSVNIVAHIQEADAVAGWGLDLDIALPGVASWTLTSIGSDWFPGTGIDPDGLVGFAFPDPVWGPGKVLATVEISGLSVGVTDICPSVTPGDDTEGFVQKGGEFVAANFICGTITVTPEPTTLSLVALAGLVILRRR